MAPPEDPGCVASPFPFPFPAHPPPPSSRGGRVRLECWEDEGQLTWFRSILHFWVQPPPWEGLPTKTGFVADDCGANFVNTYSAATRLETEPADRFLADKGKGKKEMEKATTSATSVTNGKTTERGNRGTNKLCTLKPARRQSEAKNSRTRRTFRGCAESVVADDTSRLELFEPPPPTTPIFGEQPAAEEHCSCPFASSQSSGVENQQPPSDTLSGNYSRRELSSSHSTSLGVRGSEFAANLSQRKFCRRRSVCRERTVDKYCSVRVTKSWNSEVATTGKNSDEGDRKRCPQSIKRGGRCDCDCAAAVLPVSGGGRPSLADGAVTAVTRQSTALTSHSTVTGRTPPPTPTAVKREATGNRLDTQPALTEVQALSHTGRKFSKTTGRGNRAVSASDSLRFKADGLRHTSVSTDRYHDDSGRRGGSWCAFNASGTAAAAPSSNGTVVSLRPDSVSVLIKEIGKDVDLGLRFSSAQCAPVVVTISDHVSSFSSKADKEIGRDVDLGRLPTAAKLTAAPRENTAISTAARFSAKGQEKNVDSVERSRGLTRHATPTPLPPLPLLPPPPRQRLTGDPAVVTGTRFESFSAQSMIPVAVSESVAIVKVPRYAERSVESAVHFKDMRRHKSSVSFEPTLAPVRFADTMVVYGKDSTKKRYISRTFYEPRVKPRRFAETDFLFPKETTQRFASFLDYHIDECRRWFKTCLELKARTFTTVHTFPGSSSSSSSVTSRRVGTPGSRRDVTVDGATDDDVGYDGPGASQVFIPPYKVGEKELGERRFRVPLNKAKVDINMNGPLTNGF